MADGHRIAPFSPWLDAESAAAHLGLRLAAFLRRVKEGGLPAASYELGPRSPRWSAAGLDAAMSGSAASAARPLSSAVEQILREGREKRAKESGKGGSKDPRGRHRARVSLPAAQGAR